MAHTAFFLRPEPDVEPGAGSECECIDASSCAFELSGAPDPAAECIDRSSEGLEA